MTLPAENATDPLASMMLYETADLATLSVKKGDKPVFSLDKLHVELTPPADGKPMEFTGAAEKFSADLSQVDDPQSKAVIDALGYQQINGYFEMAGSWQPTDGRIGLSQYDISVENAGTLGMTFDLGGYTLDFVKSMQDMQKQMAAQPAGADNSAQGLAMLGLMQQLTFNRASIRCDDDSLTKQGAGLRREPQSQKPEDIANQAKAIVPFLMAQLNNPELTPAGDRAVDANISTIRRASRSRPSRRRRVPFALIMAGAMSGAAAGPGQDAWRLRSTANED